MKVSKLFHWCYAILMFLPFIGFVYNFFGQMFSQGAFTPLDFSIVLNMLPLVEGGSGIHEIIVNVYSYMVYDLFGFGIDNIGDFIVGILSYWTLVSIWWLMFDIIIYLPLLIHRFIDKAVGGIE